jgi:superoxide reductase
MGGYGMTDKTNESCIITRRGLLVGGASIAMITGVSLVPTPVRAGSYEAADLGLFAGINRVKDPNNVSGLEKKHAPHIQAPGSVTKGKTAEISVSVGSVVHPMGPEHWIERVRLFTDTGLPLADVSFARTGVLPICDVHLTVEDETTVIAQASCNLHGIWESRHTIKV